MWQSWWRFETELFLRRVGTFSHVRSSRTVDRPSLLLISKEFLRTRKDSSSRISRRYRQQRLSLSVSLSGMGIELPISLHTVILTLFLVLLILGLMTLLLERYCEFIKYPLLSLKKKVVYYSARKEVNGGIEPCIDSQCYVTKQSTLYLKYKWHSRFDIWSYKNNCNFTKRD